MAELGRCSARVWDSGSWPSTHQCKYKAIVVRDGKGYCKQHDPVEVAKREAERVAKWDAEREANAKMYHREAVIRILTEGVETEWIEAHPHALRELIAKEV